MISKVTISDIARRTGFDKSTVSLVLSRKKTGGRISEPTRERILAAVKELNYRPNMLARGLRGGRTHSVGILLVFSVPDTTRMARSLTMGAMRHGCTPYVVDSQEDPELITSVLLDLLDRQADGVIIETLHPLEMDSELVMTLKYFRAAVVLGRHYHEGLGLDQIVYDSCSAIRAVADHFARSGRQRPAFLKTKSMAKNMTNAFTEQLGDHGITVTADQLVTLKHEYDQEKALGRWEWAKWAYEAMEAHCSKGGVPFDALLCPSDVVAVAAMSWLRERGLRIPEDVAVVGFNNTDWAGYLDPPLASVARQRQRVSALVEEMLFSRLEKPDLPIRAERIAMEFVHRESAGGEA